MKRDRPKSSLAGAVAVALLLAPAAPGGEAGPPSPIGTIPMQAPAEIRTLDDLVDLSAAQLDQLYRQSNPGVVPTGKVRGRALYPDARNPRARSNAARVAWQGKIFHPETSTAVNKFFGVRAIKGNVSAGESWLDGRPSIILDYRETSRLYAPYRDEIREVAPGLYLGLMYDRTTAPATLKMYFAFDARV